MPFSTSLPTPSSSLCSSPSATEQIADVVGHKRKRRVSTSELEAVPGILGDALQANVSSHAERRRQKKRTKITEKGKKVSIGDTVCQGSKPTAAGTRQNSVWVGNLSFKTKAEDLNSFFAGVGDITRVHMPMQPGGNIIRGFAYVDFATADSKPLAIGLSEKLLLGRRLLIKDGDDFSGRPAVSGVATTTPASETLSKSARKILRTQKQPPGPTLFLGNLDFEATSDAIRELFEAHRKHPKAKANAEMQGNSPSSYGRDDVREVKHEKDWIRQVRIGTFEDSGKCKGWAFVDFTCTEYATTVLVHPKNHRLNGRHLVVEYASPDAVRRGRAPRLTKGSAATRAKISDHKTQLRQTKSPVEVPAKTGAIIGEDAVKHPQNFPDPMQRLSANHIKRRVPSRRKKPGALLRNAKRESAAIVPSLGRKIKF